MKNYILPFCIAVCLFFAGCSDSTTQESMAASEGESTPVELTEEEIQVLEAIEAAPAEEAEPVTEENYEEALKQLEEELNEDQ